MTDRRRQDSGNCRIAAYARKERPREGGTLTREHGRHPGTCYSSVFNRILTTACEDPMYIIYQPGESSVSFAGRQYFVPAAARSIPLRILDA